jgi:acetyltransferase-like isoleucine patch superfamily enzyme
MRQTDRFKIEGPNSLWQLYQTVSFFKVMKNFVIIQLARYTPFLPMKNWLYRTFLRMHVGKQTSFALMVMVDLMFPERITVGHNSIIGYNTTILTHEYLIKEYRLGHVTIGDEVMIGANCTILPGVTIGDGATVAAGTIVSKDIPAYSFAKGNPVVITESK